MKLHKLLCLLLALGLLFSMLPPVEVFARQAEAPTEVISEETTPVLREEKPALRALAEDFSWEIQNGTLYIRGNGDMPIYTSGTAPWFAQREAVNKIIVCEGITGLSSYCFVSMSKVTEISLPSSLKTLADAAFATCLALEEITIPEGITALSNHLFIYCEKLAKVNLPQSLTTIGESAFECCTGLKTIDLPQSVTNIGKEAFSWSGIETIDLPDNITSLQYTFRTCENLTSVDLPKNLLETYYVFENCPKLTQITFPAGIKSVGWYTVSKCENLKRIIFTGALPGIDLGAFDIGECEYYYPKDQTSWHDVNVLKNYGADYATYYAADINNICTGSHVAGETKVFYIPNTCMTYGANAVTCKNCSTLELVPLKPSGHAFYPHVTPAGAATNGYTREECMYCGWEVYSFPDMENLTYEDALLAIKNTMAQRRPKVSFSFLSDTNHSDSTLEAMYYEALLPDGNPRHGDYMAALIWFYNFRSVSGSAGNGQYKISVTYEFTYLSTESEEMYVTDWLNQALESMDLAGKSDFEKIRIIHDWVTHRINYDYSYSNYYPYEALRDGVGVCNAYAIMTCYLMVAAGLDCRYVVGDTAIALHAWNLVKLDGKYYHIDCTWDDPGNGGQENYKYFLSGTDFFWESHTPWPEYDSNYFYGDTPLATENYYKDMGPAGDGVYWILHKDNSLVIGGEGAVSAGSGIADAYEATSIHVGPGITSLPSGVFWHQNQAETVFFEGDMPEMGSLGFLFDPPNVYYPGNNPTWENGDFPVDGTWKPYIQTKTLGTNIWWVLLADGTLELFGNGKMDPLCQYHPWVSDSYSFIQKIIIHEGITNIGSRAFSSLSGLKEVSLPSTLTEICDNAFIGCRNLTKMNLPEGLTHIGNGAFQICSGLTSITFPKSLEHIGPYAFSDCTGIRELYFLGDAPTFNTYCFGSVTATGYYKANRAGWDDITSLYLGGNITWVGLTSITLGAISPISTSVGETVTLQLDAKGDDLKFIWYLGDSQIGTGNPLVFTADSNMNGKELYCVVSNPEGESATSNKVTITVYDSLQEDVSRTLGIDYDQYLYLLFTPKITCVYSFIATDAEILSAGLSIPHGEEFTYASFTETGFELTYKLEAGQPYILRIFSANSSYRDLDFKLVVTRTHGNLNENITKPATCTENGKVTYTCGYCNHTWQDIIPAGHNYVNGTCINCSKEEPVASGDLTDTCWWELCGNTLYIYGTGAMPNYEIFFHQPWYNYQPQIQKILVADGITSVGVYCFAYCSKATQVTLPNTLESIGDYGFQNCRGLETINLGDLTKLTSIGSYCFYSCNELKEIIILGNVKQLGEFAFCSCSAVTRVEFLGSAPSMDTTPFMGVYADAWHPVNDPSWTADVRSLHQTLRWQVDAYSGENPGGNENPGGDAPEGDLLRGDVDCNGKIDTDDVVALLLYLTMPDMFQLKPGVDVDFDKNGKASTDDAITLLLHISMPDLFPI